MTTPWLKKAQQTNNSTYNTSYKTRDLETPGAPKD